MTKNAYVRGAYWVVIIAWSMVKMAVKAKVVEFKHGCG